MKGSLISARLVCCFATLGMAHAQTLNQDMSSLASSLSKTLVAQGSKNVAAIDFTDLQGQPTELGRFLSEQLAVEMVLTAGVSMLDRANIKSILAEHKLTEEGLVNPANAKKLGEFAGVDAILIGNVTSLDSGIVLMVKAISTESAKIVAAGRITFPKTSDIQQLLNRGISANTVASNSPVGSKTQPSYQEAEAIATKDLGSLRVVLKSVVPIKTGTQTAIRLSFDFISRETQRPILVAMNATQQPGYNRGYCRMDTGLRSSVVDAKGGYWRYSSVTGVGVVGVGCNDMAGYNPAEVVSLIEKQDHVVGDRPREEAQYVYGSTSTISPGQSMSVTMTFVSTDNNQQRQGSHPDYFQLSSELVVGVVESNVKKIYSLQNLTFDRVSMPVF